MKLEQNATTASAVARGRTRSDATDWTDSRAVRTLLDSLSSRAPRFVARAPGRLDIMGGFAEYCGASVVFMPTAARACVAVQPRDDANLLVSIPATCGGVQHEPTIVSLAELCQDGADPLSASQARSLIGTSASATSRCVVGAVAEGLRSKLIPPLGHGFSIAVGFEGDGLEAAGQPSAISAATLVALTAALEHGLEERKAVAVCQAVENHWMDTPVGCGDADCALTAEACTLNERQYAPFTQGEKVSLPDSLTFLGLGCSSFHPRASAKFAEARVAAFMGRSLVDRIVDREGSNGMVWDGALARMGVDHYVDRFRDRIPTKLRGQEFLDRFGETGDPLTHIDPNTTYKVRSRTEHHIYEHARSKQFIAALARAIDSKTPAVLAELGGIMYASHWSYGQRCGLGCIETDLLVNLIRKRGPEAGLYGARIAGRGCGGMVAVLMGATDTARSAMDAVLDEYASRNGRTVTVMRGSIDGAARIGARCV